MSGKLGNMLVKARTVHLLAWRTFFFAGLAALLAANLFIHPHHVEFGPDKYPGFWAAFGLIVAVAMVVVMKKIIQPMIARDEGGHDSDD